LRRAIEENVTIRDDGLGIEAEEVLKKLRRSLTCSQIVVSRAISKFV